MLKLREPFSLKIHLHIRRDMLQRLWDKYVPVSSAVYENIQLIYRNAQTGQEAEQTKQVRLLISLVLKNRMMQMGVEQYPSSLAFGIKRMDGSFRRIEKYYLTQLKSSSLTMFRTLSRYITILEQEESDNRRYRDWQKEHQVIEKQWERLRLLSLFSVQIKEFFTQRSAQMTRMLEKELFDSLSETEYRTLEESSIRQEKGELISWLKTCSETQCQQIVEQLEKEADLCRALALKAGISETGKKGKKNKSKKTSKNKHSKKKNAKIKQELEEVGIRQILELIPGYSEGEKLAVAAGLFDEKEFRLFYRQIVNSEETDRQFVMWKNSREEMLSYVEQAQTEKVQQLWTQIGMVFPEKLIRLQERHHQEFNSTFREQVFSLVEKEPFSAIADVADAWDAAKPEVQTSKGEVVLWNQTDWFIQNLEQTQEIWKENIKQREAKVFETYQDVYQKALRVRGTKALRQENVERLVEETFRNQHKESIYYESTTINEAIRSICEWGRVLLEAFQAEQGHRADSDADASLEVKRTVKKISKELSIDLEHKEEMAYLLSQISHRLEEEHLYGETGTLVLIENHVEKEKEVFQKLLTYLHELKEEQKTEFIRQLTDAVVLWQKAVTFRRSYEEKSSDEFSELKEEASDVFSVLTEETFQAILQRRDVEQLVEETFRKQHQENFYQERITEEEIRDICEWGRVVLESVNVERRTETAEHSEVMRFGQSVALEHEEELVYLIEQVNHHMEEQGIYGKTFTFAWNGHQAVEETTQELQRLLTYLHELREEQKTEFIRQLTDAVVLWQQVETSRRSYGEDVLEEFSVLKEETTYQMTAKRREEEQLVEENFRKQHKENIYKEYITEEEIRNICKWGRVILETVDTSHRTETADMVWRTEAEKREQRAQAEDREWGAQAEDNEQRTQAEDREWGAQAEDNERRMQAEDREWGAQAEDNERRTQAAVMELYGEAVRTGQPAVVLEHEEELVYLLNQVSHRMEEEGIHEGLLTFSRIRSRTEEKQEALQKLLTYLHELREEQKTEFVRQLTDAIVIWQQMITSRLSYEKEALDIFSTLKEETYQTIAKHRKEELLAEETIQTAAERREEKLLEAEIYQTIVRHRGVGQSEEETYQTTEEHRQLKLQQIKLPSIGLPEEKLPQIGLQQLKLPQIGLQQIKLPPIGLPEEGLQQIGLQQIGLPVEEAYRTTKERRQIGLLVEEAFQRQHKENIYQEQITREEIQNICEWGRVIFDSVDMERRPETAHNLHQTTETAETAETTEITEITETAAYSEAKLLGLEKLPEQEAELVYLIRQINHYMEKNNILGEASELIWRENRLGEEKTEKLVTYIRKLREEQKTEFVRQLADAVLIWQQMNTFRQIVEKESTGIFLTSQQKTLTAVTKQEEPGQLADADFPGNVIQAEALQAEALQTETLQFDKAKDAEAFYRELWECGEALLFYPEQDQAWEEAAPLPAQEQEVLSFSDNVYQEDIQTQVIRRQIEAVKDRNSLQQLITRINYQINSNQMDSGQTDSNQMASDSFDFGQADSYQKKEVWENTVQKEEMLSLVYADSQLKTPSVQKLISHIRTLDEEQYDILVKELSKVIRFQWMAHSGQEQSDAVSDKLRQKFIAMQLYENPADTVIKQKETDQGLEAPVFMEHRVVERLAAAYPGLAWQIQEYERRRQQTVQSELQGFAQTYITRGIFNQIEHSEKILRLSGQGEKILQTPDESGTFSAVLLQTDLQNAVTGNQKELGNYWESNRQMQQELQYSIQRNDTSDEERQRAEMRMQQETIQMKSAQEQLDKKLKEVETQLKKVESSAKAKEDVNVFAEQVKKRLYEELHVEKLRRGLV